MRRLLIALVAIAAGSCYAPSAPSGSYSCADASDCPDGLACTCGMCVAHPEEAACSFRMMLQSSKTSCTTADLCVAEGEPFMVTLTALDGSGNPSRYGGTATLGATWGHTHYAPYHFTSGSATVAVALDRATPADTAAVLSATAGGNTSLSLQSIVVDPTSFTVAAAPTLVASQVPWAKNTVGFPSVIPTTSGATMYFHGTDKALGNEAIGRATSTDGVTFTPDAAPVISSNVRSYAMPAALDNGPGDLRLFAVERGMPAQIVVSRSQDGGATFDAPQPLANEQCDFCDPTVGQLFPSVLRDPRSASGWLLYFSQHARSGVATLSTSLGVARSPDEGMTWALDPIPVPATGTFGDTSMAQAQSAQVVWDADAQLYRMYLAVAPTGCAASIYYATSTDGLFFAGARQNPVLTPAAVPWGQSADPYATVPYTGVIPSAVSVGDAGHPGTTVYITLIAQGIAGLCPDFAIGRATRP